MRTPVLLLFVSISSIACGGRRLGDDPSDAALDGSAQQDAGADSGTDGGPLDGNASLVTKRVFVTKATHTGNFGSLGAADTFCETAGQTVESGTHWKAWMSGGGLNARSRITTQAQWVLVGTTTVAFASPAALMGSPSVGITKTETQETVTMADYVWTGAEEGGNASIDSASSTPGGYADCAGWTSADPAKVGTVGRVGETGGQWTMASQFGCSSSAHLVCLEL